MHGDHVFAVVIHIVRNIDRNGRVGTVIVPDQAAVEVDGAVAADGVEQEENPLAVHRRVHLEVLAVPRVVIVEKSGRAAAGCVRRLLYDIIMGECDVLPLFRRDFTVVIPRIFDVEMVIRAGTGLDPFGFGADIHCAVCVGLAGIVRGFGVVAPVAVKGKYFPHSKAPFAVDLLLF